MTKSIERIREQVARVREEHGWTPSGARNTDGFCSRCGPALWPCPTLRLAEKMLKLAEWIEAARLRHATGKDPAFYSAERILAECAEENGESDLPAGYTRVDPADGFGG